MGNRIEAIFFDMGGTLRRTVKNEDRRKMGIRKIIELLGSDQSPTQFDQLLTERAEAYKKWSARTLKNLSVEEIWIQWLLPDYPVHLVTDLAPQLNKIWRDATGVRTILPEAKNVIVELFRRNYRLGLISNTISPNEAPASLQESGIRDYFEVILLATEFGRRKPHPSIFLAAAQAMLLPVERCAYVGNSPTCDVAGCRNAGFAKSVILHNPEKQPLQDQNQSQMPDHVIHNLNELLDIFPPRYLYRSKQKVGQESSKQNLFGHISLSSMWSIGRFSYLSDFFLKARELGFTGCELNYQVDSSMLEEIDLGRYWFSSIHEPCPADVPVTALKERNWLISAADEVNRQQGVRMVKRSINLARDLGAKVVVVHAGNVGSDQGLDAQLRNLFKEGRLGTSEFVDIKEKLISIRTGQSSAHLEAVRKSILQLVDYASQYGICLGIENRYHYLEIPSPDEMQSLLDLVDSDTLGFWYDVGHAQALDRLGFYPHDQWLIRFASRIVGIHLHDVRGINDHMPPGMGEVDFSNFAKYFPPQALRIMEIQPKYTPEQIQKGMQLLYEKGCFSPI